MDFKNKKILFVDLSNGAEDLTTVNPNRYGGVRVVPAWLRETLSNFYTLGHARSFENLTAEEKRETCFLLSEEENARLRNGESFDLVTNGKFAGFDLIFHHCPDVCINTNIPTLVWCPGFAENVHPRNRYILCHNFQGQKPVIKNNDTIIFDFVLGVPIPSYQNYPKENFLFQCTNHFPQINSHLTAQICNKHQIKCYFAGPIAEGYNFLKYIDNKNTFYLGVIDEQTKIDYLQRAKGFVSLYQIPINECPLGIKQALAYGCAAIVTPIGHLNYFIHNWLNGLKVNNEEEFVLAWNYIITNKFDTKKCYDSVATCYGIDKMVDSLLKVFEKIL